MEYRAAVGLAVAVWLIAGLFSFGACGQGQSEDAPAPQRQQPAIALAIERSEQLAKGSFAGTTLTTDGRITLNSVTGKPAAGPPGYVTHGIYTYETALPAGTLVAAVRALRPDLPPAEATPLAWSHWPSTTTDIITQVRFLSEPGGAWSDWQPRNLLAGGDFDDQNRDGIPDWTSILQWRSADAALFADGDCTGWAPPKWSWWHGKNWRKTGNYLDANEHPPASARSLRLERTTADGQDTAEMRRDLVPPNTTLTVSGWNRYDLGTGRSRGVMARFHEFDAEGNRNNKFVLLGDDDFHQPAGNAPWRWRALTITTMPTTVRLGIYPIRMITAQGRGWAANWEVRQGTVYSESGGGRVIFREDFRTLDRWQVSPHDAANRTGDASGWLVLKPQPLSVATAIQKDPILVEGGKLYAFRIAMQNDAAPDYDATHDTWVSCYLEFLDANGKFLDYVKAMAFRPLRDRPVGAAMHAPPGATRARFRLCASHITYGDRKQITKTMNGWFGALHLEESVYDPAWTGRSYDGSVAISPPAAAVRMQIRSLLLTRDRQVTPSFGGYVIFKRL